MRVLGYVRVSTEEQARDGSSLDAQEAELRSWAARYRHNLVAVFRDEGVSGTIPLAARPSGKLLLLMLGTKEAEGMVAMDQDRFSRSAVDWLKTSADLLNRKKSIFTVRAGDRATTMSATDRLNSTVLASVAQFQRDAAAERSSEVLAHKRRRGERFGTVPLTCKLEDGKMVDDVRMLEAAQVARMLRDNGFSLRAIGAELDRRGYAPRARAWYPVQIQSLIRQVDGIRAMETTCLPKRRKRTLGDNVLDMVRADALTG